MFTGRFISTVAFLLAISAFTAFIISNPLANFYTASYTLLMYLLTVCGVLLIIFIFFFGFVVKSIRLMGRMFQKRR